LVLFAVGKEKIGVAGGTEVGDHDVAGGHASGSKLVASYGHQIEMYCRIDSRGVPGRFSGEEEQGILLAEWLGLAVVMDFAEVLGTGREAVAEHLHDFFAYAVAAGPDARPDRHEDVSGTRAKDPAYFPHRLLNDPSRGSSPARVYRTDDSEPGINHQNGHAISRPNGKQEV
jgi:hypothetical protein